MAAVVAAHTAAAGLAAAGAVLRGRVGAVVAGGRGCAAGAADRVYAVGVPEPVIGVDITAEAAAPIRGLGGHRNEPGAISAITGILTAANLNIENMVNKGRKNVAYTMLDVTGNVDAGLTAQLSGIDTAIRVRIL